VKPFSPRYKAWLELCLRHGCTGGAADTADLIPHSSAVPGACRRSLIHGRGVVATSPQKAGTLIGLVYDPVGHRTKLLGRYLNHSETPNLAVVVTAQGIFVVTQKDVAYHEEYTVCYLDLTTKALHLPVYKEYFAHDLPGTPS
jgi:hypothetical protein